MKNNKKYPVSKLLIAHLGVYHNKYGFEFEQEEIVIVRKKFKKYVNVLNNREYININELDYSFQKDKYTGRIVIYKLSPLELGFKIALGEKISKEHLIQAYEFWNCKEKINTEKNNEDLKDAVLTQILIVGDRIKKSSINELEKETFKSKLIEIGEYYALELENLRKSDGVVLDNNIGELKLIRKCMEKLSEIEVMIPGRNKIGEVQNQLKLFKEKMR